MNAPNEAARMTNAAIHQYVHLEERARAARELPALWFGIANEPWQLFPYRQGLLWSLHDDRTLRLRAVSGLAQLGEDSPYTVWLRRFGDWLVRHVADQPQFVAIEDLPAELHEGWAEWLPDHLLVYPVLAPDGRRLGLAAYAVEQAPSEMQQQWMARLIGAYGHAWAALAPARRSGWRRRLGGRRVALVALVLAVAGLCLPVRLSVLAPAEIIALDAMAISSPIDGVIKTFHVQPNQSVSEGDLLFTLDETTLRNRREVALKQLQVARADALAAAQKAFANEQSRAELASLNGKVAERQAELVYLDDLMKRIEVRSPGQGVIVFGDVNDWQGKPVVTGERVALLGDPNQAGMLIWLPVPDAINLQEGAEIKLYLQVAPLTPLGGRLSQTSYQATTSPDGVIAYRLRAQFDELTAEQRALARIGLRGTAKIHGAQAPLAYYLFRRPLASLRELTGW